MPDLYDRAIMKDDEYSERLSNDEELKLSGPKPSFFMDKQVKRSTRYLYEEEDADFNHKG